MACSALFSQLYLVIQSNSLGFSVTYKAYHVLVFFLAALVQHAC